MKTTRPAEPLALHYARDGLVFPIPVLAPEEIAAYRAAFEALQARLPAGTETIRWSHLFFPWAYALATHPAVVGAVAAILGPDVIVRGTIIMCKQPHSPSFVSWHQDGAYAEISEEAALSAWIALSDSVPENGCMRVIPGSHRQRYAHETSPAGHNLLHRGQEVQASFDEAEAVDVTLQPGEMSLHHFNVIHGSNPNQSDRKRIGFVVRYCTPAVERIGFPVIRASGQAACSHLELVAGPPTGSFEACFAAWHAHHLERQALLKNA